MKPLSENSSDPLHAYHCFPKFVNHPTKSVASNPYQYKPVFSDQQSGSHSNSLAKIPMTVGKARTHNDWKNLRNQTTTPIQQLYTTQNDPEPLEEVPVTRRLQRPMTSNIRSKNGQSKFTQHLKT
jgi:hypothetical protein